MKKGYLRTLEAFLAFTITFIFLIFLLTQKQGPDQREEERFSVLAEFEQRPEFRTCVLASNTSCIESLVNQTVPVFYDFEVTINDPTFTREEDLFVDAIYISGESASDPFVVRLYFWRR